jgi:hypothetical protein
MIIPSTRLFTAGEIETGAYLNSAVTNLGNFMLGKPIAQLQQTVAQSIPTAAFTAITFTSEVIDRDNGHNNVTNTSRYTAQTAGWYFVSGGIKWNASATGQRISAWYINGVQLDQNRFNNNGASIQVSADAQSRLVNLNVNDYIELRGYQDSGAALLTATTGGLELSYMSVVWVSA